VSALQHCAACCRSARMTRQSRACHVTMTAGLMCVHVQAHLLHEAGMLARRSGPLPTKDTLPLQLSPASGLATAAVLPATATSRSRKSGKILLYKAWCGTVT
jgi:hypothetical protein